MSAKPIDQKALIALYKNYFAFRGMKWPPAAHDAIDFAVTEVAEALDAIKQEEGGWVRHNKKDRDLGMEISQAVMMLAIAAEMADLDIIETTYAWMRAKGYEPELWAGKDFALWAYPTKHSTKVHLWGLFGQKKNRFIQSACGLEFPEKHHLDRPFVGRYPRREPICDTCKSYWESGQRTTASKSLSWLDRVNRKMRGLVERGQRS